MGCGGSKTTGLAEEPSEGSASPQKKPKEGKGSTSAKGKKNEYKLLLLGTGGAGKSTFLKQLKFINHIGPKEEERSDFLDILRANIVKNMKRLVDAAAKFKISLDEDNEEAAAEIQKLTVDVVDEEIRLSPKLVAAIKALWKDSGIQKSFERSSEFQLDDGAAYFFDKIDAVVGEDYIPSEEDMIRLRTVTTGIVEEVIPVPPTSIFRIVDVGGQRNERKKWIHGFNDVTAVIFVTDMSGFDRIVEEDLTQTKNVMLESLDLFGDIINTHWFNNTPVMLFLNKKDLFEEKVVKKKMSLKKIFPEYDRPTTYKDGSDFLGAKFRDLNATKGREVYIHETCAIDKENIITVFQAMQDVILSNTIDVLGI